MKEKKHYVNNKELRDELIRCAETGELSESAALMFKEIAERLSTKLFYKDPADREDAISSAIYDCIKYWKSYDPEKSQNAFSYFTSVCSNGFGKFWKRAEKVKMPDSVKVHLSDDNIYSI